MTHPSRTPLSTLSIRHLRGMVVRARPAARMTELGPSGEQASIAGIQVVRRARAAVRRGHRCSLFLGAEAPRQSRTSVLAALPGVALGRPSGQPALPLPRPPRQPFQRPGNRTFKTCSNTPGNHLTEALSKRHSKGAGVASLRLFTINRNGVDDHWNRHPACTVSTSVERCLLCSRPWQAHLPPERPCSRACWPAHARRTPIVTRRDSPGSWRSPWRLCR